MNTKRLHKLADFIEKADYGFNMSSPEADPECGTAGCIAGHAAVLWPSVREHHFGLPGFSWDGDKLTPFLGISDDQHEDLFFGPAADGILLGDITRSMAVAAVRRFADTGKIEFKLTD